MSADTVAQPPAPDSLDPRHGQETWIGPLYERMAARVGAARTESDRPLTLTEKILIGHLAAGEPVAWERRKSTLRLAPDRVAMQDATAQMAILQFISLDRQATAVPTTVHCDHLIRATDGAESDLAVANDVNREVYAFLRSASMRYQLGFWEPGSGIIHQVVLENYAFPGGLMIGTDSHTPNAGGLGMIAIGVGGADAVDVMAARPFQVKAPGILGVKLTGVLAGFASPKDVIIKLAGLLTVKGGTGFIVEYFGPGCQSISATGKATITNMGAEIGATTSIFPYDERLGAYLRATERGAIADLADANRSLLQADPEVLADPASHFDQVIEIDLGSLVPLLAGPHSPDLVRTATELRKVAGSEGIPLAPSACLIGSCTNSSYEDLDRCADLARQAAAVGLEAKVPLLVTPGSEGIHATIRRDRQMADLEAVGAVVLANACGPCIGQWDRPGQIAGEVNSIISSYNRNFRKRNDGDPATLAFVASPETVLIAALAGRIDFDPTTEAIPLPDGGEFRFRPPQGRELPEAGYVDAFDGFLAPDATKGATEVVVAPASERLALLEPFSAWDGGDLLDLHLLIKAKGKCTTDHISPAGFWLRYRGHLDRISDNMFSGAFNAYSGDPGRVKCQIDGETKAVHEVARHYKATGAGWVAIGEENYGEGSSREHAAMSPRLLGCRAVVTKMFARIHEANLKKQGVLPLIFADPADYDKVQEADRVDITGLSGLVPGSQVTMVLKHADGSSARVILNHSLTAEEITWFKAGAALNTY